MNDTSVLILAAAMFACGWAIGRASAVHSRIVIITTGDDDDGDDFGLDFPVRTDPSLARLN